MMECSRDVSPEHHYVVESEDGGEWSSGTRRAHWAHAIPAPTVERGDCNFEYILMAPTSPAIPIHEEPVTFLNQHIPYEVKCRTSDPPVNALSVFRTVISICFESRKIRYEAKKQVEEWKRKNPGKRFILLDVPMCTNISGVKYGMCSCEFVWDSTNINTSIFLKFFVVSSDFISNAGEKGSPFRLVVQTYLQGRAEMVHQCSSRIQLFKLRGAERKRLTEREKASKLGDQEQFQPSYDYTILLSTPFEYEVEDEPRGDLNDAIINLPSYSPASESPHPLQSSNNVVIIDDKTPERSPVPSSSASASVKRKRSYAHHYEENWSSRETSVEVDPKNRLRSCFCPAETAEWLRLNRFGKYINLFADFDGEDMLRISVPELSSLMNSEAEAIRLFYAMRKKILEPQCVLYLAVGNDSIYNMATLQDGSVTELRERIRDLSGMQIDMLLVKGPRGIRVAVTDEVVQSWPSQSIFRITFADGECLLIPEEP